MYTAADYITQQQSLAIVYTSYDTMNTSDESSSLTCQILTASIPPSQFPLFFKNKLRPLLPYSLPLYRRCQFFLYDLSQDSSDDHETNRPGQPELWVAISSTSPANLEQPNNWLTNWLKSPEPAANSTDTSTTSPWIANHIDLREPGQTQIWTFSSWEATASPLLMSSPPTTPQPTRTQITLARSLYHHLRTHHIPSLPTSPSQQYLTMKAAGKIISSPYKRSKILFGTLAEANWWIVEDSMISTTTSPSASKKSRIVREDRSYLKYLLARPYHATARSTQFRAAPLSPAHLQTVLDRSVIPRTLELLSSLVTTGLFPADSPDPLAWGLLGKDASISSLHTEFEYRGQGLAEVVVSALMERIGEKFDDGCGDGDVGWFHMDVSMENRPSQRVFEKMGASVKWRVGWVEVDVEE